MRGAYGTLERECVNAGGGVGRGSSGAALGVAGCGGGGMLAKVRESERFLWAGDSDRPIAAEPDVDGREAELLGDAARAGSVASGRVGDSRERVGDGERCASCTFPGSASGELVVGVNALAPPNRSDAPEERRRGIRSWGISLSEGVVVEGRELDEARSLLCMAPEGEGSWPDGKARGERAGGAGKYPPASRLPESRSTTDGLLRCKGAACASCSLIVGDGSSGCRRWENDAGPRGVVGVKSDCECDDEGSCGGSSFKSIERWVARRVSGLCAVLAESEPEGPGEGLAKLFEGRSRRKGSGFAGVTGEFSTASRTGSKAGIFEPGRECHNRAKSRRIGRLDGMSTLGRPQRESWARTSSL